jgi:uncharacterized protein YndB with AHSA1/START domain
MSKRGFTIVRRLEAPPEVVFQAWTDPQHLRWFENPGHAPRHPTTVDLRVGGAWRLSMVENDTKSYTTGGIYREIVRPERLVFSWGAVGGWPDLDPDHLDEAPLITIRLEPAGENETEMTVHLGFADHLTEEEVQRWYAIGVKEGMTQTVDRIVPYLKTPSPR